MIYIFTTRQHKYATLGFSQNRALKHVVCTRSYDWLFRKSNLKASVAIFTDFERLRFFENVEAARIAGHLASGGIRIINHPAWVRQRYDLLTKLRKEGINSFRVYRAVSDPEPTRFPVFLKSESNHKMDVDRLFQNQQELENGLLQARKDGLPLNNFLVTEFANSPIRNGIWQRLTVHRIGETYIAAPQINEARPFVKYGSKGLANDDDFKQGIDIVKKNKFPDEISRAFEIANIEYGRADFSYDEGKVAIYEINTNPDIPREFTSSNEAFNDAYRAVQSKLITAMKNLDTEDKVANFAHRKPWYKRLDLAYSPTLKR